jgi:hypothetical protein
MMVSELFNFNLSQDENLFFLLLYLHFDKFQNSFHQQMHPLLNI